MVIPNERVIRSIPDLLKPDARVASAVARAVDREFTSHMEKQFETEGSHGSSPWVPLSPQYKEKKDRLFSGAVAFNKGLAAARGRKLTKSALRKVLGAENKILQLTGDMRRAFTRKSNPGHLAYGIVNSKSKILIFLGAQGKPYYAYHQDGGDNNRPPQRPIVSVTREQLVAFHKASLKAMYPFVLSRMKALARIQNRIQQRAR